ncbi:MAG: SCO1664 family protein, partial [Acidimicrobiales bacterium]|nr:SCO1664 family protein [Acidimicrobiales bacterium]
MDTNQLVNEKRPENEGVDSKEFFDSANYLNMASKVLDEGNIDVLGRMPYSSNATLLADVTLGDQKVSAIYKPVKGEKPLWDFPAGLHRREIAAFILSKNLGWGIIPPTVERDGPFGIGSLQLFIETDYQEHHFTLVNDLSNHDDLKKMCVFDLIANNTDRKSGHCLISHWGQIYGIDQGLCFSEDFKL